jgi:hypothetical protein
MLKPPKKKARLQTFLQYIYVQNSFPKIVDGMRANWRIANSNMRWACTEIL